MTTGESVLFWVLATIAVAGALGVVSATKAVYSALCLAATMVSLAVLYIAQGAVFLGVGQIVVYTGAVMMLFLFVLMLIGVDSSDSVVETIRGHKIASLLVALGLALIMALGLAATAQASDANAIAWDKAPGKTTELRVTLTPTPA